MSRDEVKIMSRDLPSFSNKKQITLDERQETIQVVALAKDCDCRH